MEQIRYGYLTISVKRYHLQNAWNDKIFIISGILTNFPVLFSNHNLTILLETRNSIPDKISHSILSQLIHIVFFLYLLQFFCSCRVPYADRVPQIIPEDLPDFSGSFSKNALQNASSFLPSFLDTSLNHSLIFFIKTQAFGFLQNFQFQPVILNCLP